MTPNASSRRAGRATSTTLDVVLCLLLVSAAVGVLAAADPPSAGHDPRIADQAATLLATTTSTIDAGGDRRVHGTLAALLARAAVADFAVDATAGPHGAGGTRDDGAFAAAVANRTAAAFAGVDASVNVTASYAPLPGSDARGEVAVGAAVPRGVDVSVVRIRVPVGSGPAPTALRAAAETNGVTGLARDIAAATIATTLPPSQTRWQLRDPATRPAVVSRYRRLSRALDASTSGALAGGRVSRANAVLARALADRYVAAIRANDDGPEAAAAAARPRVVVLTVRTWSP